MTINYTTAHMDDFYAQKTQIENEAQKTKDEADRIALEQKQALADQQTEKIRREAEEKVAQIQSDAQQ